MDSSKGQLEYDAAAYEVYLAGADAEYDAIMVALKEALRCSCVPPRAGLAVLDIGAGNGHLLARMVKELGVTSYVAFEPEQRLAAALSYKVQELQEAASTGGAPFTGTVLREFFTLSTTLQDTSFDLVLLCHSLYTLRPKEAFIEHAMRFASAPSGVVAVFHRWDSGALQAASSVLSGCGVMHAQRSFQVTFSASHIAESDRETMSAYMQQPLPPFAATDQSVLRRLGVLAIEPHSCRLSAQLTRRVGWAARQQQPMGVAAPTTVTGVQACVREAALRRVRLSVVGGGHSGHCMWTDALALDLAPGWSGVVVDASTQTVTAGGGATLGAIVAAAQAVGMAVPLGDRPGVGMGLVLQGGLGHLTGRFGLSSDNIVRCLFVSPDGVLHTAQSDEELWRIRGAGSNFGVVLEVTLRMYPLTTVVAQDTFYKLGPEEEGAVSLLQSYSAAATKLPQTACLDAFLLHSSDDAACLATSLFDSAEGLTQPSPLSEPAVRTDAPVRCRPLEMFDRELYMTDVFAPGRFESGEPSKLRSFKRCVLLPPLHRRLAALLVSSVLHTAPNKWCYIHLVHAGGAAASVPPLSTAFGVRAWEYAAVITGQCPDGEVELQARVEKWVEATATALLPLASGVYGADLGPFAADAQFALRAFGCNTVRLADMKRVADPLGLLTCTCPLLPPPMDAPGLVVLVCGRRFAGKDWLAARLVAALNDLLPSAAGGAYVAAASHASISDGVKAAYASAVGADLDRLMHERPYKEAHRAALTAFYQSCKATDPAFDARCFAEVVQAGTRLGNILVLTGIRNGLEYARELAGRPLAAVHVKCSAASRAARGWVEDCALDGSPGEEAAEAAPSSFFDLVYENDGEQDVARWVVEALLPALLRRAVRKLPDTPRPGVVFKDVLSLLHQPAGLGICTALLERRLRGLQFDAVLAPEASGWVFAGALARAGRASLLLARKPGRIPGPVVSAPYDGSNISVLGGDVAAQQLDLPLGAVQPLSRILLVDDTLASGHTLSALAKLVACSGGRTVGVLVVMELPDLGGRARVGALSDAPIHSLFSFDGK